MLHVSSSAPPVVTLPVDIPKRFECLLHSVDQETGQAKPARARAILGFSMLQCSTPRRAAAVARFDPQFRFESALE
jgi:hypothetical protein